jgi:hypothetical protein
VALPAHGLAEIIPKGLIGQEHVEGTILDGEIAGQQVENGFVAEIQKAEV